MRTELPALWIAECGLIIVHSEFCLLTFDCFALSSVLFTQSFYSLRLRALHVRKSPW